MAEDGPLAGDPNLTVEDDDQGRWPSPVVWRTAPDERHVYRLVGMALRGGRGAAPLYGFDRTLGSDEDEPAAGWSKPPH